MKRNHSIERALRWQFWRFEPRPKYVIPPKSIACLKKKDSDMGDMNIGDTFRVGYYRKQDGPNTVWLVDDAGVYFGAWDQQSLLDYFEIIEQSGETDTYGSYRPILGPQ